MTIFYSATLIIFIECHHNHIWYGVYPYPCCCFMRNFWFFVIIIHYWVFFAKDPGSCDCDTSLNIFHIFYNFSRIFPGFMRPNFWFFRKIAPVGAKIKSQIMWQKLKSVQGAFPLPEYFQYFSWFFQYLSSLITDIFCQNKRRRAGNKRRWAHYAIGASGRASG